MLGSVPLRALVGSVAAALVLGCASSRAADAGAAREQLDFGVSMAERGLWNEAMFRFEQARTLAPKDVAVLNNLAVAYEAVGRFDDALATYRAALEIAADQRRVRQNYTRFLEFYQSYKARPAPAVPAVAPPKTPAPGSAP
jgi:Flp pilus assembly protein TadD